MKDKEDPRKQERELTKRLVIAKDLNNRFREDVKLFLLEIMDNCFIAGYDRLNKKILHFCDTHYKIESEN